MFPGLWTLACMKSMYSVAESRHEQEAIKSMSHGMWEPPLPSGLIIELTQSDE